MIEQNSSPKKERVGSLFFHLFHRLSVWLYTLLCNCLPARLLTCYETLELRWDSICTRIFGAADGKLRKRLHHVRLTVAGMMEKSKLLYACDKLIRFILECPLNVFGTFFLIHGSLGAAIYFISDQWKDYTGDIGWGLAGIVIAVCSLPLLCSSKPLYHAMFGSRLIGKILRSYLGLEPTKKSKEKKTRTGIELVYAALVLGVASGVTTYLWHPAITPIALAVIAAAITVLYIPEAGVLLALATFPYWWVAGNSALCALSIVTVTLISFINKLIRGRRVLHIRLLDFVVLLLCLMFATHGIFSTGGFTSVYYGIGYTLLIAMYFPVVSLMRSKKWLDRCYRLLAISGAVLSVISVLPFSHILEFLDMVIKRVDFSMMTKVFANYEAYFGNKALIGGILLMLLPVMLTEFVGKRTITGFFWKALWVVIGCISVFFTMQLGAWIGLGVAFLLFFFMYSYRSMSRTILLAFPAACAVAWSGEIERWLNLRNLEIVQATMDVIVTYCNGAAQRQTIAKSVLRLSKDHMLGVGLGEHAVEAVFPYYAAPGMESLTDMQNAYLQILTECGYLVILMFGAVLLLFCMSVLTFLRYHTNRTTKIRSIAGLAGIAGVFVLGFTANIFGNASVFVLFWLILAISTAGLRTQYETFARAVQTHTGTKERTDIALRSK